jgi:chromosome segregation ATPase
MQGDDGIVVVPLWGMPMSEERLARIEAKVDRLEGDVGGLRGEVGGLRSEVGGLRGEVGELRSDVETLKTGQGKLGVGLEELRVGVEELRVGHQELRIGQERLWTEVIDLRRHMGVLHEEVLENIKALAPDPALFRRELQAGLADLRTELVQRIEPLEAAIRRKRRR